MGGLGEGTSVWGLGMGGGYTLLLGRVWGDCSHVLTGEDGRLSLGEGGRLLLGGGGGGGGIS